MSPDEVVRILEAMEEREGVLHAAGDRGATEVIRARRRQEALRAAISAVRTVTATVTAG